MFKGLKAAVSCELVRASTSTAVLQDDPLSNFRGVPVCQRDVDGKRVGAHARLRTESMPRLVNLSAQQSIDPRGIRQGVDEPTGAFVTLPWQQ